MKTPICDFVQKYQQSSAERLHMPGHKGQSHLGYEPFDLTEIDGADSLFSAKGIIAQSEQNASALFGAHTFYSTEGSSLAIKAMLLLVAKYAKAKGQTPLVLAGRNAHKAFVSGVALVDVAVEWIFAKDQNYLSCNVTAEEIANVLDTMDKKPTAVYLTSPDYLGNVVDVASIAKVCKARDVLLVVDNAHGAYLKFASGKMHPIDLGADMCCDSAHKTLPCLTGGAYLHISKLAPAEFCKQAKNALALFASTSPSYLILQSLDKLNGYLADGYPQKLNTCMQKVQLLKQNLRDYGWTLVGNEPLKITLQTKPFGYTGDDLASYKKAAKILREAFPDFNNLDALSEIEFYKKGLVKTPVCCEDKADIFRKQVDHFWTYYCCGQVDNLLPNRMFSQPSLRNRVLGILLYKYDAEGFLHWGHNFWYSQYSKYEINPYKVTDAGNAFPSGDAFVVYPGKNGEPLNSL
ncbi:MAG: aminotransferase class V-fold PLP-dependent enzyme, partial [Clostridia bacterium]|nr:aminotransferase class V-fold PLP-dependent enzyme [Clostridia bacterium]